MALLVIGNHEDESHSESAFLERERYSLWVHNHSCTILKSPKPGFGVICSAVKPDLETKMCMFLCRNTVCGATAMPSLCGERQELSYKHSVTLLQSQKISVPCPRFCRPASLLASVSGHPKPDSGLALPSISSPPLLRHRPTMWSRVHPSAHAQRPVDDEGQTPKQASATQPRAPAHLPT